MKLNKKSKSSVKKYLTGGVIGGAIGGAAGIGQAIYGGIQMRKANKEMQSLLQGAPKLELPSAYKQYAEKAMDESALRAETEAINRRLSSSTQALSQAGGRALLGGLQAQVSAANQANTAAQQAQLQREMQGLQVLGGAQSALAGQKEARFQMQYGEANAAKQAAAGNVAAGLGTAAKGALTYATSLDNAKNGMKTKGEFSHETNPITMTDKNGNVVGEATGGEIILNPTQAKAASKESKYLRSLLKKKQFKG